MTERLTFTIHRSIVLGFPQVFTEFRVDRLLTNEGRPDLDIEVEYILGNIPTRRVFEVRKMYFGTKSILSENTDITDFRMTTFAAGDPNRRAYADMSRTAAWGTIGPKNPVTLEIFYNGEIPDIEGWSYSSSQNSFRKSAKQN